MILNIYKPKGITSFKIVSSTRRQLGVKKVGHAGTLDPLAQGVLIILTEQDTKRQSEFMHQPKEYVATVAFNLYSPSYDLEIVPNFVDNPISLDQIKRELPSLLPAFTGDIFQQVPAFSAVKHKGQPLYKKARKGKIDTQRLPSKLISISKIEIEDIKMDLVNAVQGPQNVPIVILRVNCSSGTYIRSLARDLGEKLGTQASLIDLIRTRVGDFNIKDSQQVLLNS